MENRRELDHFLNIRTHIHTQSTSGMPTHHLPFFPFSPLPSSMLSSPAVLIHRPSQELRYPSGQAQLQLGGERDVGAEGWKRGEDGERGVGEYDVVQRWFDGGVPEKTWEAEGTKKL